MEKLGVRTFSRYWKKHGHPIARSSEKSKQTQPKKGLIQGVLVSDCQKLEDEGRILKTISEKFQFAYEGKTVRQMSAEALQTRKEWDVILMVLNNNDISTNNNNTSNQNYNTQQKFPLKVRESFSDKQKME